MSVRRRHRRRSEYRATLIAAWLLVGCGHPTPIGAGGSGGKGGGGTGGSPLPPPCTSDGSGGTASSDPLRPSICSRGPFLSVDPSAVVPANGGCAGAPGRVRILARTAQSYNHYAQTADSQFLYYSGTYCGPNSGKGCNLTGDGIRRVPRCGGEPQIVVPPPEAANALLDGGSVVYAIPNGLVARPGLLRIDKATGLIENVSTGIIETGAATRDGFAWRGEDTNLYFLPVNASEARLLATSTSSATLMTAVASRIYWSDGAQVFWTPITHPSVQQVPGPIVTEGSGLIEALIPAVDRLYLSARAPESADHDVYQITLDGVATPIGRVPYPLVNWDAGKLYYTYYQSGTFASAPDALAQRSLVLRYDSANALRGWLFWQGRQVETRDSFIFAKPALEEAAADPFDPAIDGPAWTRKPGGQISTVEGRSGSGFALAVTLDIGDPLQSSLELFSDPDAEPVRVAMPSGEQVYALGSDAGANLTALIATPHDDGWHADFARFSPDGSELLRGELGLMDFPPLAVAPSGRFAAWGRSSSDDTYPTQVRAPDGTLLFTVPAGTTAALDGQDRLFVSGLLAPDSAVPVELPPPTVYANYLQAFDASGASRWARVLSGLHVLGAGATTEGDVVLAGTSFALFDVGRGLEPVAMPGRTNAVLAGFTADGAVKWVRTFESQVRDGRLLLVKVTPSGETYVALSPDAGGFSNLGAPLRGARSTDPVVAHFDRTGMLRSVRRWPVFDIESLGSNASAVLATNFDTVAGFVLP